MGFGWMQGTPVAGSKGILAPNAAQKDRMFALSIDVDILGPAVAPAIDIIEQTHAVHKAQQLSRPVGIQHQKIFTVALGRHLSPPAGAETSPFAQRLIGVAVPIHLQVGAVLFGSGFKLNPSGSGEGHLEVAVVANPGLDRQEVGVYRIPALAVHDPKKVTDGRLNIGDRLIIKIDTDKHFAAGHGYALWPRQYDPKVLNTAWPIEFGIDGFLVRQQRSGHTDAVGDTNFGEL